MARSKKNKIFDLFKSDFKITFFYKPSMNDGDEFYYLVLDEVIRLKIKDIKGVIVIDDVVSLTNTYIKPIYEQIVRALMKQSKYTVLVALTGNSISIQQACVSCNCPIVDDERYITVSKRYYQKLKSMYIDDNSKYGFYILAVGDEEDMTTTDTTVSVKEEKPKKSINDTPVGVEPPITRIGSILKNSLKEEYKKVVVEPLTKDSITVTITPEVTFTVEIAEGGIYIKELLQQPGTSPLNLIKLMNLVNSFQLLKTVHQNVYILSVQNAELSSLCLAKGFTNIQEEQKLPMNRLFRQAFHGYGTYQVV